MICSVATEHYGSSSVMTGMSFKYIVRLRYQKEIYLLIPQRERPDICMLIICFDLNGFEMYRYDLFASRQISSYSRNQQLFICSELQRT